MARLCRGPAMAGARGIFLQPARRVATAVLGIETSCDDTCAAIVTRDGRVLGHCVNSQWDLVRRFGGVFPAEAQRAHAECIDQVVDEVMRQAGVDAAQLRAVAVTVGPGLAFCLRVGISKAQQLARQHRLALLGVHHMEAHALMPLLHQQQRGGGGDDGNALRFPFAALLLSGGHTMLALCKGVGSYSVIGSTLDDALGEALDKGWRLISARADSPLVASSHPGRALEQLAEKARSPRHPRVFSVPLLERGGYDFSFSGLKSNLARFLESGLLSGDAHTLTASSPSPTVNTKFSRSQLADVACAYQDTAFSHVVRQVERAFQSHHELQGVTTLAVSGGVASNAALRAKLARLSLRIVVPKPEFCVDNGIMVAWAGQLMLDSGIAPEPLDVPLSYAPRWPLGHPRLPPASSGPRVIRSGQDEHTTRRKKSN